MWSARRDHRRIAIARTLLSLESTINIKINYVPNSKLFKNSTAWWRLKKLFHVEESNHRTTKLNSILQGDHNFLSVDHAGEFILILEFATRLILTLRSLKFNTQIFDYFHVTLRSSSPKTTYLSYSSCLPCLYPLTNKLMLHPHNRFLDYDHFDKHVQSKQQQRISPTKVLINGPREEGKSWRGH